jgi:hypothetical protein
VKFWAYIRTIFDDSCPASFSKWATAFTVGTSCWAVVHLVRVNHALPDPLVLGALSVWMTTPYGINKIAAAFSGVDPSTPTK